MKQAKKIINILIESIQRLPVMVPAALAGFGIVAVTLLLVEKLENQLVWPIGLLVVVPLCIVVWKSYSPKHRKGSVQEQKVVDALLLIGLVLWAGFNMLYTAQNVFVYRDPAIYTVAAEHIRQESSLTMEKSQLFSDNEQISATSAAFGISRLDENQLYTQGMHLLPVLLGLLGRITNTGIMLHAMPILGAAALLSVYGLARLVVKPRWAALSVGVLALSLPMISFSRDTYSEPLAMIFTFGALSALWHAQKSGSRLAWGVAGLIAGAGALTRIDAYMVIGAMVLSIAVWLGLAAKKDRRLQAQSAAVFAICALCVLFIAWQDLTQLSSGYYSDLRSQVSQQVIAAVLATILGVLFVIISWKSKLLSVADAATKKWRGKAAFIGALFIALVFISRPLWLESHHNLSIETVGILQQLSGNPVQPTRDYAEQTATWVSWYIGPVLGLLSVVGLALLLRKVVENRKYLYYLPVLAVVISTVLVFFNRPSITPDQVWASRRLLPIILPGLAIFGVYAIEKLSKSKLMEKRLVLQCWGLFIAIVLFSPMVFTAPFIRARTYTPQLEQINKLCAALPEKSAVVWAGTMAIVAPRTTSVFCNTDSFRVHRRVDIADLNLKDIAQTAYEQGYIPVIGADQNDIAKLPPGSATTELERIRFKVMPASLYNPPTSTEVKERAIHLGIITKDGLIVPLVQE